VQLEWPRNSAPTKVGTETPACVLQNNIETGHSLKKVLILKCNPISGINATGIKINGMYICGINTCGINMLGVTAQSEIG
jgi:hypothetical protein